MKRYLAGVALLFAAVAIVAPAQAERLGYGRLVSNDLIGDAKDRWQTGSVASSRVYGPGWSGGLPASLGEVLELRFNGGAIAPANIMELEPGDRPFAGYLSFGLHSHASMGFADLALGADLVLVGPQTGIDQFQTALHDSFDYATLSDDVRDNQIEDGVFPTMVAEVGRDLPLGNRLTLRPFGEARLGAESLVRLGADVTIGNLGQGALLVREPITGQRYRVIDGPEATTSFVLGGDVAYVDESVFLPTDRGFELTDSRTRLRAGVHWQGERQSAFYGITYLSEEFEGQPEGQVVGSMRIQLEF